MFIFSSKEKIINYVYELRKERKLTQEELANAVDVTRQTIIAIERGNYIPSVLLAFKIANYFNLELEKVFKYEKK